MKRALNNMIFAASILMSAVSCDYRELYTISGDTCDIWVAVDWSEFTQENPTGMSVYCYPRDDTRAPYLYKTNNISGVMVSLPVGTYDILVFNQSVDEFGSMRFEGMDRYSTAAAVLEEKKTGWKVNTSDGDSVMYEPEWLGVDTEEGLTVTREMVEKSWRIRPWSHDGGSSSAGGDSREAVTVVTLVPENMIYTAYVTVRVYGIHNLYSAQGSISGMAEGAYLSNGRRTSGSVSHVPETWSVSRDPDDRTKGYVHTSYRCLGLPDRETRNSIFNISFLLVDGKTVCDYAFQVGDRIEVDDIPKKLKCCIGIDGNEPQEPSMDADPVHPTILPDVIPTGEGGFTTDLEDWDDTQIIDILVQ